MTGYISKHFRHQCDDQGCYITQLPSWDDLLPSFPRGIRPTDIDGMVEINDHVLFIEEKRAGVAPDEGQRRAMYALATRERVTVVFIRPGRTTDLQVLIFPNPDGWKEVGREWFKQWLTEWAESADRVTSPP